MKTGSQKVSTEIRGEQVVQSALKIIAEKGTRNLTRAAIVKDAGIPRLIFSEEIHRGKPKLNQPLLQSIDS